MGIAVEVKQDGTPLSPRSTHGRHGSRGEKLRACGIVGPVPPRMILQTPGQVMMARYSSPLTNRNAPARVRIRRKYPG